MRQITSLNQTVNFGKHAGKKVSDIITAEPNYLLWMADNTRITVDPAIVEAAQNSFDDECFGTFDGELR
jgi:hypothetical protein